MKLRNTVTVLRNLPYRFTDISNDVFGGGPWTVDAGDAHFFEARHIFIGDDASDKDAYTLLSVCLEQLQDAWRECHMRSGQNGESHHIHIFLQRSFGDHLRSLPQASINDF